MQFNPQRLIVAMVAIMMILSVTEIQGQSPSKRKRKKPVAQLESEEPGHDLVKRQQFLVPVGTRIPIKGLEFDSASSALTTMHEKILMQVFNSIEEFTENTIREKDPATIQEYKNMVFEIRGYSDGVGPMESGLVLSKARANRVYDFLTNLGTPPRHLQVKGLGPANPNNMPGNRGNNRRVEFLRLK